MWPKTSPGSCFAAMQHGDGRQYCSQNYSRLLTYFFRHATVLAGRKRWASSPRTCSTPPTAGPPAGVRVRVYAVADDIAGVRRLLREGTTNADGRCDAPLLEGDAFKAGVYEIVFGAGAYFAGARRGAGRSPPFVGDVVLRFGIADAAQHYHVPLLGFAVELVDVPGQLGSGRRRWRAGTRRKRAGGDAIRFVLDGEIRTIDACRADHQRAQVSARGPRPDRHQGRLRRGRLRRLHRGRSASSTATACAIARSTPASSSCPTLDGKALFTVESLKGADGTLHPVAAGDGRLPRLAVRLLHAGLRDVAVRALQDARHAPDRAEIGDALAGNLCRCTGYRPIVDAGADDVRLLRSAMPAPSWMNCSFSAAHDREATQSERELVARLRAIRGATRSSSGTARRRSTRRAR